MLAHLMVMQLGSRTVSIVESSHVSVVQGLSNQMPSLRKPTFPRCFCKVGLSPRKVCIPLYHLSISNSRQISQRLSNAYWRLM